MKRPLARTDVVLLKRDDGYSTTHWNSSPSSATQLTGISLFGHKKRYICSAPKKRLLKDIPQRSGKRYFISLLAEPVGFTEEKLVLFIEKVGKECLFPAIFKLTYVFCTCLRKVSLVAPLKKWFGVKLDIFHSEDVDQPRRLSLL